MKGICALCRCEADLKLSHLIPRGLYKVLRAPERSAPDPVIVGRGVSFQSSEQITDYLLCADCEERLNRRGESWVIANCWRSDTDFPIHAALAAAAPVSRDGDFAIYEAANISAIDVGKLVYFAVSIFWRSACHEWPGSEATKPQKLSLGPYEEQLRTYLMDAAEFPLHAALHVAISSATAGVENGQTVFPWLRVKNRYGRMYQFLIPGISFRLYVGKKLTNAMRHFCTHRSAQHFVISAALADDLLREGLERYHARSQPVGGLARRL